MWQEAQEVVREIRKLYSDSNRFIDGECNCDSCVAERIGEQSKGLFDKLHVFFSKDLKVFSYNGHRFKSTFKALSIPNSKIHLSQQEKVMLVLEWVCKENISRSKRIPKTRMETCRDCGVLVNSKMVAATTSSNGKIEYICAHCSDNYTKCSFCGELRDNHRIKSITYVDAKGKRDRKFLCGNCMDTKVNVCKFCGDFHAAEETSVVEIDGRGPQNICKYCHDHRIQQCDECGMDMYLHDHPREGRPLLCGECYSYKKDILSYNFRPRPIFLLNEDKEKQFKDTLFFGTELEIEKLGRCKIDNSMMSRYIRQIWPSKHVYCVHDGSLESGFEIVSQPFTWSRFIKDRPLWDQTFDLFKKYGYSNGPRAGMHVHMSKAAFTTVHLYKFVNFLYKDSTRLFLQAIAQRKLGENQYCKFDKVDVENTAQLAKYKNNMADDKHHAAVNLENNATIETRIFAMPAESDGMFKNLQFMHSLYVFSRQNKYKDMVVSKYLDFLTEPQHRGRYRHLLAFLRGNQYLKKSFPAYFKKL